MPDEHLPVFVYGTLKQGEERERMWPHPPLRIERAVTRGRLFDLGPYPAMLEGDDLVAGELWHVAEADMKATLAALDDVECFGNDDVDLYIRRIVSCWTSVGEVLRRAHAYFFADELGMSGRSAILPDADGLCRWTNRG